MAQPATGPARTPCPAPPAAVTVVPRVPRPAPGGTVPAGPIAVSGLRAPSGAGLDDDSRTILVAVALGAGSMPLAAPARHADFPSRARTVLGSGTSAGLLVAVLLNLILHHLGTHSRTAVALKSP